MAGLGISRTVYGLGGRALQAILDVDLIPVPEPDDLRTELDQLRSRRLG